MDDLRAITAQLVAGLMANTETIYANDTLTAMVAETVRVAREIIRQTPDKKGNPRG